MTITTRDIFLLLVLIRPVLDYFADTYIMGVNPASILAIIIILLFLLEFISSGDTQLQSNRMIKGFAVYFLLIIPSILSSGYLSESFTELLKYLCELSCIYLTFRYCVYDDEFKHKLLKTVLRSSIIPLIYGFYQIGTQTGMYDKEVGAQRVYSTFVHPNQYAIYLVVVSTVALLLIMNTVETSRREKYFSGIIFGCSLANLLFTYSRTCWIWFAIIVIGIIIFNVNNKWIIAIDILLVAALYFLSDMILNRFLDVTSGSASSLDIRQYIVRAMMPYVIDSPIIGHGLGTFDHWSSLYVGNSIQSHNEYFKTLFESGILGFLGLIFYFGNTFMSLIKKGLRKNYLAVFFFLGFMLACYYTNTLSSLSGQIYFVIFLTIVLLPGDEYVSKEKNNYTID